MGVYIVALAEVLYHLLQQRFLALGLELVVAPPGAHLLAGRHEYLQLGVREHCGAYVPAVHDYAALAAEFVETAVHPCAHIWYCGDGTHLGADFHGTDLLLYAAGAHEETALFSEVQFQPPEGLLQGGVYHPEPVDQALFLGEHGDTPVQGSGVQIKEVELARDFLGKGALAGSGVAVYGYYDVGNIHISTNIKNIHDICRMKILIIDDERSIRNSMKEILSDEGYIVETAEDGARGYEMASKGGYDVIFCDIKMPGMDGVEVLGKLEADGTESAIVMISGHGDIETAVDCIKKGAFDFIEKPLDLNRLLAAIKNATDKEKVATHRIIKKKVFTSDRMVGESEAICHIREIIEKVAATPARVLITGGNGSGKELVARSLHALSDRASGPYVEVNCAAIPSELIESELFGHEKGSFTSAIKQHKGKFEQADGGTLFLDEIGDMSLAAQAKVLRVLQENKLSRVGSDADIKVDVRVIAATNKDLRAEIEKGTFREDLYHRLSVIVIKVPGLDERKDDIPLLVDYFVDRICSETAMPRKEFTPEAVQLLQDRCWKGNIRELRNVVERLLILGDEQISAQNVRDYVL